MEIKSAIGNEIYGTGIPVVFLHGMGSSSSIWKPIVKEIEHDRQCVLFDFPGHGDTPLKEWDPLKPEDIAGIIMLEINRLNIDKFHLVAHSLGGWVGLEIASLYPDRVLSFTSMAPAGLWRHKNTYDYPSIPMLKLLNIALPLFANIIPKIDKLKKIAFSDSVADYKKVNNKSATDAIIAFSKACNSWYNSKRINKFQVQAEYLSNGFNKNIDPKVPITVIFGMKDISFTIEKHQDSSLLHKGVKWICLPDSGHVPIWDNYDKVVSEIKLNIYPERQV
jgi:pimeloyl-ACP methyl ester carboxylesterase